MGRVGQFVNKLTGGLVGNANTWVNDAINNGNLGMMDVFFPGSSAISKALDLKGTQAAQNQYQNQLALDEAARAFNAQESQKQRDWEQMMSSTAIQRQVSDARAAGINPIALFGSGASGAGADVPSGSSASSSSGSSSIANNKLAAAAGVMAIFLRMLLTKGK